MSTRSARIRVSLGAFLALAGLEAEARVPFWGATESRAVDTVPADLAPGEFIWNPGAAPAGPIAVVVSLDEQRAYVYRNGIEIGVSTVSSGKRGHETPTGIFTILQKDKNHRSSIYNNAPMPFTERLTWDGVSLHAGGLPGYPSSHGCVHLPSRFAEELFAISPMGMTVVVVNGRTAPAEMAHPPTLAPVDLRSGEAAGPARLADSEQYRWQPEKSITGPLSIVMSSADLRVVVLRNGVEIGRARLEVRDPGQPLGTHAFVLQEGIAGLYDPLLPGAPLPRWVGVAMPGHFDDEGSVLSAEAVERVRMPPEFVVQVFPLLEPGTTMLVTDAPLLTETTGQSLTVLANGEPT